MMLEAYKDYWTRYTDFSGRTTRSDYWMAFLVNMVVSLILQFVLSETLYYVWGVVNLVPGIAMAVRRMRSADKNPFLLFLGLIPLVNLVLIYFLVQPDKD